jgi:hypothetical protein
MATSISVVRLARLLYCAILVINMPLIWRIWLSSAVPGWLKQGELPGFCGRMRCTRRSAAREPPPRSRASSVAQAEISTAGLPSYQASNKLSLPKIARIFRGVADFRRPSMRRGCFPKRTAVDPQRSKVRRNPAPENPLIHRASASGTELLEGGTLLDLKLPRLRNGSLG